MVTWRERISSKDTLVDELAAFILQMMRMPGRQEEGA
jgi:hypothetical protein